MLDASSARLSKVLAKGLHLASRRGRPPPTAYHAKSSHQVWTHCEQDRTVLIEESENMPGWEVLGETRFRPAADNASELLLDVGAASSVETALGDQDDQHETTGQDDQQHETTGREAALEIQIKEKEAASRRLAEELASLKEQEAESQKSKAKLFAESRKLQDRVSVLTLRAEASRWTTSQREAALRSQIEQKDAVSKKLLEELDVLKLREEASRVEVERSARSEIEEHRAASQKMAEELTALKLGALSQAVPEDLECAICRDLLLDPVTVMTRDAQRCGHTFCRDCLQRQFAQQWRCPSCRASAKCVVDNVLVRGLISERFPQKFALRVQEHRDLHPEEQRIDQDGMAYTFNQFLEFYGPRRGPDNWSASARRPF